jgi:hypothetical protein
MKFSAWPFPLQVVVGILNFSLASVLFLWWPKRDQHWNVLRGILAYFIAFWLLFVRW